MMMVRIIYFVHGTTTDNEEGISSGWKDAELSALGIQQAKKLREQTRDLKFAAVFCSDLKRAADTAQLAFEGISSIIRDERLRECNYGTLNGGSAKIVEPLHEQKVRERFEGGESYEDVKNRMADFLGFLKQEYDGQTVGIVAHKAPQLSLDVLLKGKTWEQALAEDWRKTRAWQPGWEYVLA